MWAFMGHLQGAARGNVPVRVGMHLENKVDALLLFWHSAQREGDGPFGCDEEPPGRGRPVFSQPLYGSWSLTQALNEVAKLKQQQPCKFAEKAEREH